LLRCLYYISYVYIFYSSQGASGSGSARSVVLASSGGGTSSVIVSLAAPFVQGVSSHEVRDVDATVGTPEVYTWECINIHNPKKKNPIRS
jgi:hypothetical protein